MEKELKFEVTFNKREVRTEDVLKLKKAKRTIDLSYEEEILKASFIDFNKLDSFDFKNCLVIEVFLNSEHAYNLLFDQSGSWLNRDELIMEEQYQSVQSRFIYEQFFLEIWRDQFTFNLMKRYSLSKEKSFSLYDKFALKDFRNHLTEEEIDMLTEVEDYTVEQGVVHDESEKAEREFIISTVEKSLNLI